MVVTLQAQKDAVVYAVKEQYRTEPDTKYGQKTRIYLPENNLVQIVHPFLPALTLWVTLSVTNSDTASEDLALSNIPVNVMYDSQQAVVINSTHNT